MSINLPWVLIFSTARGNHEGMPSTFINFCGVLAAVVVAVFTACFAPLPDNAATPAAMDPTSHFKNVLRDTPLGGPPSERPTLPPRLNQLKKSS